MTSSETKPDTAAPAAASAVTGVPPIPAGAPIDPAKWELFYRGWPGSAATAHAAGGVVINGVHRALPAWWQRIKAPWQIVEGVFASATGGFERDEYLLMSQAERDKARVSRAVYEVQCIDPPRLFFFSCLWCDYAKFHATCIVQTFDDGTIKDDWIAIDGLDEIRFYGDFGYTGGFFLTPGDPLILAHKPVRRVRRAAGSVEEKLDLLEREMTVALTGHRLDAAAARVLGGVLRAQFASAERRAGRQLVFPARAPRLWKEAKAAGMKIREFIEETYGPYVREYRMTRADVRRLDPAAVKALENWVNDQRRRYGKPVDIEEILPKGPTDPDAVEARQKASGKDVKASDWRGYRDEPMPLKEAWVPLEEKVADAEGRRRAHAAQRKRKSRAKKGESEG